MMGNTVGSLEPPILLHARKNLLLAVTDFQREILTGCVLGDAHITTYGKIRIEQSANEKEYVFWKYNALSSLLYHAQPRFMRRFHVKNNTYYRSFRFSSRQYFRSWRLIFYPIGKKIFPQSLKLTPISLAVWYMDDGCWTGKKAVLSTEGFDDESRCNIQNALQKQFSIASKIGKNKKMLIRKNSHAIFFGLIRGHVIPSMRYKIPNPVTTKAHSAKIADV